MVRQARFDFIVFLITWAVVLLILSRQRNSSYLKRQSTSLQQSRDDQILPKTWKNDDSSNNTINGQKPASVFPGAVSKNVTKIELPEPVPFEHMKMEPPTRFRSLFREMYASNVDTGLDHVIDPTRYLIYRCDTLSMAKCGGWADRLRGVMAGYIIANLTGRVFKSEILMPSCDIQKYIEPNLVNWSLPISFHERVSQNAEVGRLVYSNDKTFWTGAKNVDFRSLPAMKAKYVYYKSNLDYMDGFKNSVHFQKEVSWMKHLTRDQINAVIFKRLFKLTARMQNKLDAFLADNLQPNNRLVCIHLRTGRNPTLPFDTADRVRENELPRIWNYLSVIAKDNNDKIFIMSDSENVIANAKTQPFRDRIFVTPGKIVHIENSRGLSSNDQCEGLEKVVLEQFILMHCDSLVISKSGLSRMSAYVRGSDQDLYCLLEKGLIVPCKNRDVQQLFGIMG